MIFSHKGAFMALSTCNQYIDSLGKELLIHDLALFPIAAYQDDLQRKSVALHWHEEVEIGIVTAGQVKVNADSSQIILSEGQGFYIAPGVVHCMDGMSKDQDTTLRSIVFDPLIISGHSKSLFHEKYVAPVLAESFPRFLLLEKESSGILSIFSDIWKLIADGPKDFEIDVRDKLTRLFQLLTHLPLLVTGSDSTGSIHGGIRIKQMLQYIHLHYHENISLKDIAFVASISKNEALRQFNIFANTTPIQYLIHYRMDKAAQLLIETDEKIADICHKSGYSDISYFTKFFRQVYGMPPGVYRKKFSQIEQ